MQVRFCDEYQYENPWVASFGVISLLQLDTPTSKSQSD